MLSFKDLWLILLTPHKLLRGSSFKCYESHEHSGYVSEPFYNQRWEQWESCFRYVAKWNLMPSKY